MATRSGREAILRDAVRRTAPQDEGWEQEMTEAPKLLIPLFGRLYAIFAPFTELLIRLIAGGSLAFHGYQILFGNIEGAGRFFESGGLEVGQRGHGLVEVPARLLVEVVADDQPALVLD